MMKKTVISAGIFITALVVMAFKVNNDNIHYSPERTPGAPSGYSGDPAGNNLDCTGCHSGPDAQMQTGWITTDVPGTGYVPNTTYTLTATDARTGHTKFGFQISPQNSNGTFLGTLISTDSETTLTTDPNYITHTSAGTGGTGSKTWTFEWTAPDAGSGDVTFYGAFNLTNNNGSTSGDTIMRSTLTVSESTTGIDYISGIERSITIFPNPARDRITLEVKHGLIGSSFLVVDQAGRQVLTGQLTKENTTLDINQLAAGIYYVQIGPQIKQTFQVIKE
jgi:hypothetical protein